MSTDIAKFSKDHIAAWNSHDWEKLSSFLTDDCIYEDISQSKVCHGKKELKSFFDDMLVWSADFNIEFKTFFLLEIG